jgi:hypothetical protein
VESQGESALKMWFGNVREKNTWNNGPIVRQKAETLAKTVSIGTFSATNGWFKR